MPVTKSRNSRFGTCSYGTKSGRETPRKECVARSYRFDQPRDHPDATRDENKRGDSNAIKHEHEFDSSDEVYTFRYYVPPNTDPEYFQDDLQQRRDLTVYDYSELTDRDYSDTPSGKVVTTTVRVGDLFKLGNRSGTWRFVGVAGTNPSCNYHEMLVFEPHDRVAENYIHPFYKKPKSDFGQKFGPFEDIIGNGHGHRRVGTTAEEPIPKPKRERPDNVTTGNKIGKPNYPNHDKGPMRKDGLRLKTYDHVPQNLRKV